MVGTGDRSLRKQLGQSLSEQTGTIVTADPAVGVIYFDQAVLGVVNEEPVQCLPEHRAVQFFHPPAALEVAQLLLRDRQPDLQQRKVKRFGQVIVRPGFQRGLQIIGSVARGGDEQIERGPIGPLPQASAELKAVNPREHQINDDQRTELPLQLE
jgi:hypothetical protein